MKRSKIYHLTGITLLVFLLSMCMTITDVIQPNEATVGETIGIKVKVDMTPEEDVQSNLIFAVLVPKDWNIADNASASFSSGYEVDGIPASGDMRLTTADELAKGSDDVKDLTWPEAMETKFGIGENYGEVEWVVFISENKVQVKNGQNFSGDIDLRLKVGDQNLKTQLGYVVANTQHGLTDDGKYDIRFTDCMEIKGGSNPLTDLCGPAPVNTITFSPETFSWNDLISIKFDASIGKDGEPTELYGATQVYLCARVIYARGTDEVCEAVDATKMRNLDNNLWEITIWPRSLFDIPDDAAISELYFSFMNEDGSVVSKHPYSGDDFQVIPNCY